MAERPYLVKLVRDRVGRYLGGEGVVEYREITVADHPARVELLRDKLVEEAIEYLKDPSLDEAVDVLQVLYDLLALDLRVGRADLERARADKYNERGGFLEGIGMFVTTTAPDPRDLELAARHEELTERAQQLRTREFEIGDRVEVLGGTLDQMQGVYKGRAPKAKDDDEDGYLVQLDGRDSVAWVKFLAMRSPDDA